MSSKTKGASAPKAQHLRTALVRAAGAIQKMHRAAGRPGISAEAIIARAYALQEPGEVWIVATQRARAILQADLPNPEPKGDMTT